MAEPARPDPGEDDALELSLARLLRAGVLASAVMMACGLAWLLATGWTGYPAAAQDLSRVHADAYPHTPGELVAGLVAGRPLAVSALGLFVLVLTPVFRVAASALLFARRRDVLYTAICTAVLLILLFGMALGAVGGHAAG